MRSDREFLSWVADRLVNVYGENPDVDFVHKLRGIADKQPDERARQLAQQALDKWGRALQLVMVIEECAELQHAVTSFLRQRGDDENLAAEAADVEIMLEFVRILVGDDLVDKAKAQKLDRLQRRIDDG